jgi:predicted transcriptional regulator
MIAMAAKRDAPAEYRGELQSEVMAIVWRRREARVEDVRAELPVDRSAAYTTVQTVMNRLVERGLLSRQRSGQAFVYRPAVTEADFVSRAIGRRLSEASPDARRSALLNLIGDLEAEDLDEVARYARRIRRARAEEQ